jgi:hypothetical protein
MLVEAQISSMKKTSRAGFQTGLPFPSLEHVGIEKGEQLF